MTAQMHENLILDGKETSMAFCPALPKNDPRIVELKADEVVRDFVIFSTACWRHYIGTWEIKGGRLYLVNLVGKFKLSSDEPIFADWFTGTLKIPQGEMLDYVHKEFDSVYERELHINVENGVVKSGEQFSAV